MEQLAVLLASKIWLIHSAQLRQKVFFSLSRHPRADWLPFSPDEKRKWPEKLKKQEVTGSFANANGISVSEENVIFMLKEEQIMGLLYSQIALATV